MLISLLVTLVFGAIYFYVQLPALNIHAADFYTFVFLLCAVYCICSIFITGFRAAGIRDYLNHLIKKCTVPVIIVAVLVAAGVLGTLAGSVFLRAKAYAKLLPLEAGDFAQEVEEVTWDQIPKLDENSANTLANKKMGELSDLVSQFEVNPESVQINYQDRPVRAAYLDYGGVIKWWNNRRNGIPAYLLIDMVTQEVSVQRLEQGMKYSPSEIFNRNIYRHLRFRYPTKMFYDVYFEVADDGTPYWCATTVTKTIGLFGGTDVTGAVLINAVTGEGEFYEIGSVPSWVDRVCSARLIMEQYDYYGLYQGGFWNSILGQSGCTKTTSGYNYIAMDDDVWVYTGVTSVGGDESNLGFILVNQRTKESRYYSCAGANEHEGMNSAEGAVQQYSSTVEECQESYAALMQKNGIVEVPPVPEKESGEITGRVAEIRSSVMDGDTYYFIRLQEGPEYYLINGKEYPVATILNVEDKVTITYYMGDTEEDGAEEIRTGVSMKRK